MITFPASLQSTWLRAMLLFLLGTGLLLPFVNQQGFLSTGDHGRELYAFAHIFDGKQSQTPYQDYWWMYGPLMLYYYGFCMKIFGVSLLSVLIGKTFLLILAGTFIGLTVMAAGSTTAGLAAAAWFWITFANFFHTHNHTGGVVCIAALAFLLSSYIRSGKNIYLWITLATLLLLAMIKLNIGLAALLTTILIVLLIGLYDHKPFADGKGRFFLLALLAVPLAVAGIHALFLHGLSTAAINECFPFGAAYRQYTATPWQSIKMLATFFIQGLSLSWPDRLMTLLVFSAAGRLLWTIHKKLLDAKLIRDLILSLAALGLLFVAMLHEYLLGGIHYCVYWAQPLWMTTMFILIAASSRRLSPFWKTLLWSMFGVLLVYLFAFKVITSRPDRSPENFFRHPRVQAYIKNDYTWRFTMNTTTAILQKNLRPGESFFAFPYDPLYYYLTDRPSPTWQTCFFAYQHIPPEQEQQTVADLEKQHVNWVVVSNRIISTEAGLGVLGRDYCPLLAKYLNDNFAPVFQMGAWGRPAGWAWNYGSMLLRRKSP